MDMAASNDYPDFNPRSPHGERLHKCNDERTCQKFQSTLPAWGATSQSITAMPGIIISIHAPRMGSDHSSYGSLPRLFYFNPRSPHGERRYLLSSFLTCSIFQSTLPAWGATEYLHQANVLDSDFNPRSPHGERPGFGLFGRSGMGFQSTLPAWGATTG